MDWRPANPADDGDQAWPVLQFIFDGGTIPADTELQLDEESRSWRWATLDETKALQGPAGHARLRRAYQARSDGTCGYGTSMQGERD